MKVVVTGACGYIGSHLIARLAELGGYDVIGYTNRHTANSELVKKLCHLRNGSDYSQFLDYYHFRDSDAFVHLGGYISVAESMINPMKYYEGNTKTTIDFIKHCYTNNFIFASTAACFDPVSHYAKSKLACEWAIRSCVENHTIFRFFNVAGINPGHHYVNPTTHIISKLAECIVRDETFYINGNDYNTPDGTCVRDYIDINDLVDALVKAINIPANTEYECLGNGKGYSNMSILKTMELVTGKKVKYEFASRREGDPASIVVENVSDYLTPSRNLYDMCGSTYEYFKNT